LAQKRKIKVSHERHRRRCEYNNRTVLREIGCEYADWIWLNSTKSSDEKQGNRRLYPTKRQLYGGKGGNRRLYPAKSQLNSGEQGNRRLYLATRQLNGGKQGNRRLYPAKSQLNNYQFQKHFFLWRCLSIWFCIW